MISTDFITAIDEGLKIENHFTFAVAKRDADRRKRISKRARVDLAVIKHACAPH
jgi:hypothetical protein